jgi:hypothetical protein
MNPWAALAAVVIWVASIGGSYWYGTGVGKDSQLAKAAEIKQAIEDTREIARQGAASEIAKIKVRNTTIQGKVETIVRDNPVYRDCKHDPDAFRLLNDALSGKAGGAGRDSGGSVPRTVSPIR